MTNSEGKRVLRYALIAFVVSAFLLWSWLDHFSLSSRFDWSDPQVIIDFARQSGMAGPLVIVAAMTAAIVFSPLPSAPIAMAAGAIYGHYEGTFYVFVGALLGASIAFGIARVLGFNAAHDWLNQRFPAWKLGDQRRLMWLVMLSRLLPFISFDLVSYAAGVTQLSYWRFFIATSVGILPASFLLAHFGDTAMEQSLLINGFILLILLIAAGVWRLCNAKRCDG
ncbi:MAG: TVP38/TMEM64 family protein [Halopseudomonas sp.]